MKRNKLLRLSRIWNRGLRAGAEERERIGIVWNPCLRKPVVVPDPACRYRTAAETRYWKDGFVEGFIGGASSRDVRKAERRTKQVDSLLRELAAVIPRLYRVTGDLERFVPWVQFRPDGALWTGIERELETGKINARSLRQLVFPGSGTEKRVATIVKVKPRSNSRTKSEPKSRCTATPHR
jgi:hypothetical protein